MKAKSLKERYCSARKRGLTQTRRYQGIRDSVKKEINFFFFCLFVFVLFFFCLFVCLFCCLFVLFVCFCFFFLFFFNPFFFITSFFSLFFYFFISLFLYFFTSLFLYFFISSSDERNDDGSIAFKLFSNYVG